MTERIDAHEALSTAASMMLAEGSGQAGIAADVILAMDRRELVSTLLASAQLGGMLVTREASGESEAEHPVIDWLVSVQRNVRDLT